MLLVILTTTTTICHRLSAAVLMPYSDSLHNLPCLNKTIALGDLDFWLSRSLKQPSLYRFTVVLICDQPHTPFLSVPTCAALVKSPSSHRRRPDNYQTTKQTTPSVAGRRYGNVTCLQWLQYAFRCWEYRISSSRPCTWAHQTILVRSCQTEIHRHGQSWVSHQQTNYNAMMQACASISRVFFYTR